jgi:hypothetical protein
MFWLGFLLLVFSCCCGGRVRATGLALGSYLLSLRWPLRVLFWLGEDADG